MKKVFLVSMLLLSTLAFAKNKALDEAEKEWLRYIDEDHKGINIAQREVTRQKYEKEVQPYVDAAVAARKKSTDPDEQNKLDYIIRKLNNIKNIKL